jgi:hypothetical protein
LPSIESLKRRWKDPKGHCIFHMNFCTAAVGESRWKECLSKGDEWIGSNAMEAFALLVLVSTCKAWLCKEKKTHQDNLFTKHDCRPSCGRTSIVDRILDGVQINLVMDANSPLVLCDESGGTCKKLEKERVDWLEKLCDSEQCVQTNDDVLKKASSGDSGGGNCDEAGNDKEDTLIPKERAKKTRKLTRGLREFTGVLVRESARDGQMRGWWLSKNTRRWRRKMRKMEDTRIGTRPVRM